MSKMKGEIVAYLLLSLCGITLANSNAGNHPAGRILGGTKITDRCAAPYNAMVALRFQFPFKTTFCSAVMLSNEFLVTTASCLFPITGTPNPNITIILAEKDINYLDQGQTNLKLENYKIHPNFDHTNGDNNIAIIQLTFPLGFDPELTEASKYDCIASLLLTCFSSYSGCSNFSEQSCVITGWGASDLDEKKGLRNSALPRYGNIQLLNDKLSQLFADKDPISNYLPKNTLLGVAYPGSNIRPCYWDMGGMVACETAGKWKLHGLIGMFNCERPDPNPPFLVTDVSKFCRWIQSCLENFSTCLGLEVPSFLKGK